MRRSYFKRLVGRQVVVHTDAGSSIRGVVSTVATDCVVLDAPVYLGQANPSEDDLEGRVPILFAKIDFAQVL